MRRLFCLLVLAALVLAACGDDGSPVIEGAGNEAGGPQHGGGATDCGEPSARVTVVAKSIAGYEPECVTAPAGTSFTIVVDNPDKGVSHNLALFEDMAMTVPLPKSEVVAGPKVVDLAVGPLAAGTYHFHCDVHPTTMEGTLEVR